ncbi:MAG TPA: amino acid aminotransferase [Casimicrobiaceae bacterium]
MNAPLSAPLFAAVEMAPRDPILGVTEAFNADPNPNKVNLGVGVYYDESGKVPLLECVRRAEEVITGKAAPHAYLPIDGMAAYDRAVQRLLFGPDSDILTSGRVATVQALGGTGALKVAADFLRRFAPGAQVWISDPSWENHRALFEGAGFVVNTYPYYDPPTHGLDFERMIDALGRIPAGAIVVLHACCHNPTGVDPSAEQWTKILERVRAGGHIPLLDLAYQGFGDGIDADGAIARRFADTPGPLFVASSFSKSFSLYGERVGALSIVAADRDEAARALSQVKRVIRSSYSSPPGFGSLAVQTVLDSAELRALWENELAAMRERIRAIRRALVDRLKVHAPLTNFDFVPQQRGMFSYSGLTREQVARLRSEFAIYAIDSGRICVAALNQRNLDYVARAIGAVVA